uniref:NHL repeat-containing protein n=1 Tax=Oryza meridionalis TaxID=40149 RepID=A0A0E0CIE6_9ORYZ
MASLLLLLLLLVLSLAAVHTDAATFPSPADSIVRQLSSVVKWPRVPSSSSSSSSSHAHKQPSHPQYDGGVALQFESGYFVETLVEGDKLGVTPHTIRVSPVEGGELLAVDSAHSNIVRITPPLSEYSRGRLVAGSFQGHSGHIDGKPSDARFKRPTGVTVDDTGNVYVADTANLAIRKIGESGVTTIAGGKSNIPGYRDGPSEDAKFSTDFDVVYVKKMCSLLVIDRGNAALRKIALPQEDCTYQDATLLSSVYVPFFKRKRTCLDLIIDIALLIFTDIILVIGAVVAGYIFSVVQHGFGSSTAEKIEAPEDEHQESSTVGKPPLVVESLKEEPSAGWPSLGTLIGDLLKLVIEGVGNQLLRLVPSRLQHGKRKTDLTPLEDRLVMPEDTEETPVAQKLSSTPMRPETLHGPNPVNETAPKAQRSVKSSKFRDSTLSSKHRSSKRQEYAEFYGSSETPQVSAKVPKDRLRHRHREKSGEAVYGTSHPEPKPAEVKPADYSDPKYDPYNIRSKYGADSGYRY